jgi:hypothetical protein
MSISMVPAQKRPWRSQRPSLKRMAGRCVLDWGQRCGGQRAVGLRPQREQAAFHAGDPFAGRIRRGAMQAIISGAVQLRVAFARMPAVQRARRDVDPVQRLLRGMPHRAFAGAVARVENELSRHRRTGLGR